MSTHPRPGGGFPAIGYTFKKAREAGGLWKLWKAMRSKNACKTCALGMGGQAGGMVNESGHFPEVCKKSLQAMVADMQDGITNEFWSQYSVDHLRGLSPRELESCGRLTTPVRLKPGHRHFEPISWDEAVKAISDKLVATAPDESFWYFSGRSSNEAGFLLQLFARLYGTNNINNCSYYCHQASGVGLASVTGSGTATIVLDDIDHADLVFLIGGNPASNHPRLMRSLMEVRRRGGHVIVINPIREPGLESFSVPSDPRSLLFGTDIASLYVQPNIGGDLALLYGVAKFVLATNANDEVFLNEHCTGWRELRERIADLSWDEIERGSGVSQAEIESIGKLYAASSRSVFSWTMGITHHRNGVENVQAIANLALLRGMVGSPGCGLMPIRGHSNVQGIGSVGVTPKLKDAIFSNLESRFGVSLPTTAGMDTMACMEAAASGAVKFGLCLGGNLYGSNPDSTFAAKAIGRLDQMVYLSTTLNTGHAHGTAIDTIILPVLARDEEPQATTQESMFNFVRYSDGGPARHDGPRSEIDVITTLARTVFGAINRNVGPIDWTDLSDASRIRETIAAVVPGFEAMADIDDNKKEFQIGGRTFHEKRFATADGKAKLHTHDLPGGPDEHVLNDGQDNSSASRFKESPNSGDGSNNEITPPSSRSIRLMTIRSEGQFNTVVYEEEDLYRGVRTRDVILLNPADLARFEIKDGERVTVDGPAGKMTRIRATAFERIKPGNAAMYFPEANVLVDRTLDPQSRTPVFKNVQVTVRPTSRYLKSVPA